MVADNNIRMSVCKVYVATYIRPSVNFKGIAIPRHASIMPE